MLKQYIMNKVLSNKKLSFLFNLYQSRKDPIFNKLVMNRCEFDKHFFQLSNDLLIDGADTIYLISVSPGTMGFFAIYRYVLNLLYVAYCLKLDVFIEITNSMYNICPLDNMFEYYFIQPNLISKTDLDKFNCFYSNLGHSKWLEDSNKLNALFNSGYKINDEYINSLSVLKKRYIKLKPNIQERIMTDIQKLVANKKTIGVHFRGNAYKVGFYGHPIYLCEEDYYPYIDQLLDNGFKQVFVATDDQKALNSFKARYKDKVIFFPDVIRSKDGIDVHSKRYKDDNAGFELGFEVLRDMITLSYCEALVAGLSQVVFATLVEKKSRDEVFHSISIIDKGLVKNENQRHTLRYIKKATLISHGKYMIK